MLNIGFIIRKHTQTHKKYKFLRNTHFVFCVTFPIFCVAAKISMCLHLYFDVDPIRHEGYIKNYFRKGINALLNYVESARNTTTKKKAV